MQGFAADPVYAKGEVFAYVGLPQNLKDLKGAPHPRTLSLLLIDSGLVGRQVFFHHHIRPLLVRSHEKRRLLFEEPTPSHVSPSILQYTMMIATG